MWLSFSAPITVRAIVQACKIIGVRFGTGTATALLTIKLFLQFEEPLEFGLVFVIRKNMGLWSHHGRLGRRRLQKISGSGTAGPCWRKSKSTP